MWARAVWMEGNREIEGTIPRNWIRHKKVRWPPGKNAEKPMKEMREPTSEWKSFKLCKIKLTSSEKCFLSFVIHYDENIKL